MAVSECADAGLLRSATLMANGAAFDDAVKMFRDREGFGTGIHFVVTGLKPVLPEEKLSGLLGPDGLLPPGPLGLLRRIGADKSLLDSMRRELFAQAEKVFDSGIKPTHFDGHKHVHIIPAVLDVIVEIAARFSIRWVREPFEPDGSWRFLPDLQTSLKPRFLKQLAAARVSTFARRAFQSRVRGAGLKTPAGVYGISFTGLMNEGILKRFCGMLKPGLSELMTHPGVVDAELLSLKGRLVESRQKEKELLMSAEIKDFFEKNGISLHHFGEVESARQ